jgi:hypothetical protein
MKITEDVRQYCVKPGIAEEDALKQDTAKTHRGGCARYRSLESLGLGARGGARSSLAPGCHISSFRDFLTGPDTSAWQTRTLRYGLMAAWA